MTSATDELRRLLDERGARWIEHEAIATDCVAFFDGSAWHDCWESLDGEVNVTFSMTPAQAVEATLGRREPIHIDQDWVRDLIERNSAELGGNGRDFHDGAYRAMADEISALVRGAMVTDEREDER